MRPALNAAALTALTAFLVVTVTPEESSAFEPKLPKWAKTETPKKPMASNWEILALGGGNYGGPHFFQGIWSSLRLRYLRHIPFALEAGVLFPEGAVFSLMTDVWRDRLWRIHFPDFGVLYLIGEPKGFVRPDVRRRWDFVLGSGAEWQFHPRWWLTFDCRFYLPDPTEVPFRYGGFTLPVYQDSAKSVQFLIGLGRRLW
jgi:hypothetical protein